MESSAKPVEASLRIRVAPDEVTVHYWGLRDGGWIVWLNLLLAAGASVGMGAFFGSPLWGWGILAPLLVTLWRSWLPMRFEIRSHGITEFVLGRETRIPWTAILNYQIYPRGIYLFPDAVLTPLAPLRGLFLPWGSHREMVLANIEYYLAAWVGPHRA